MDYILGQTLDCIIVSFYCVIVRSWTILSSYYSLYYGLYCSPDYRLHYSPVYGIYYNPDYGLHYSSYYGLYYSPDHGPDYGSDYSTDY